MPRRLVREVIARALCAESTGFFCRDASPVSRLEHYLDFKSLGGEADYRAAVAKAYDKSKSGQFYTPSELLAPWYSRAIGRWLLDGSRRRLVVIEFGAGLGANAVHALDVVAPAKPGVLYVIVDVSPAMVEASTARVRAAHPAVDVVGVVADASGDWSALPTPGPEDDVVGLALELADNLAHDKLCWSFIEGGWQPTGQVEVEGDDEVLAPLADRWIRLAARVTSERGGPLAGRWFAERMLRGVDLDHFVPTGALQFLANLVDYAPRHRLLLADFDSLPGTRFLGSTLNKPLVAAKKVDLPSYLDARHGEADIFFATDFAWLAHAYRILLGLPPGDATEVRTCKSAEFFQPYAAPCATKSGFNPLLHDFANTAILLRTDHIGFG